MSSTNYLIDASTRHAIFLQRFAGGEAEKSKALLTRLRREIAGRLSDEPTAFQVGRLLALQQDVDALTVAMYGEMKAKTLLMGNKLIIDESKFTVAMLDKAAAGSFALPSAQQLISAAEGTPFNVGSEKLTVEQALDRLGKKKSTEIAQLIRDSAVMGDTTPQISRKIGHMIDTLHKRQAESLVRTATNHLSSVARSETYAVNADVLEGYEWVSTLDSSTTLICAGRDGQVYPIKGGAMPPAHWGCRSTTIPKVKPEFDLGSDITGQRSARGSDGKRHVSGQSTYGGWLKKQSKEFQNEALGVERAKLFRAGKVNIKGFTDPTGRIYTLDELRATSGVSLAGSIKNKAARATVKKTVVDFGYNSKFNKYADGIHENAAIVINKLPKPSDIAMAESGSYAPPTKRLRTRDNKRTFLHEYGHHIEFETGKGRLRDAHALDRSHLGLDQRGGKRKEAQQSMKDRLLSKFAGDLGDASDYNSFSDIVDSLSKGRFWQENGMVGHGVNYYTAARWKGRGDKAKIAQRFQDAENSANLFQIWAEHDNWNDAKSMFPNLTSEFEKIMQEVIDG